MVIRNAVPVFARRQPTQHTLSVAGIRAIVKRGTAQSQPQSLVEVVRVLSRLPVTLQLSGIAKVIPLGAGDASMAPPTNTWRPYQHLPATYSYESAQTLGSPRSTHTDTDTAMEMGGLSMAPGGPDLHRVTLRASVPPVSQEIMSTPDLAATVACGIVAAATQILERFTRPPQVNEADRPPVDLAANAAIREHLQRCLAATPRPTSTGQATSSRTSAFDQLGH